MEQYFLAVDIGASSGRHILGHMGNGRLVLEEVYRFPNGTVNKGGEMCWEVDKLFEEIKTGMKRCKEIGKIPYSMGIDTWAVDFVLLNDRNERLGNAVGYRDKRTEGMDEEVYKIISEEELYERTGIQKQIFNTIYQIMSVKVKKPEVWEKTDSILMIPDYFNFLLTGRKATEYTNATTTQLVSPDTKDWDAELLKRLGYPRHIFPKIEKPGTLLGELSSEVSEEVGFCCKVVLPATHDTGSAVVAIPSVERDTLYISSGTWSLMGTELKTADCSERSRTHNFTNEGGYEYRFRYLKNIMGLWMIQSVKKEIGGEKSFGEICAAASDCDIASVVDCNDARFLAPESMTEEIQAACRETGQQVPQGIAEVAAVIYRSLSVCYAKTVNELEELTGKTYEKVYVVGGGANAEYLNRLTAKATGKAVCAGPTEATAIGNLAVQLMAANVVTGIEEARACIAQSFEIAKYE